MKQLFQSLKDGNTSIEEIPFPKCKLESALVETSRSLVSAGTERMIVNFGKSNIFKKAASQKDKVQQAIQKVKSDGYLETYEAIKSKLDQAVPLGYSNVGRVVETNSKNFAIGNRVVSNGPHAEIILTQNNTSAKIPDNVSDEEACFTVVSAIALNGVRLAKLELGEKVAVIGLGLIGLIVIQLLKAQGCEVIGFDHDEDKLEIARGYGITAVNSGKSMTVEEKIEELYPLEGMDAVIITASTSSNGPIDSAAKICRKRGRIILIGVIGLNLNRTEFYNKEIKFQVSCSYGPGRYDPNYEEMGQDYPIGFVRWTVKRNFETVLDLMSSGILDVKPLISHRYPFESAGLAMDLLSSGQPALGIIFEFSETKKIMAEQKKFSKTIKLKTQNSTDGGCRIGVLGAGNYASRVLIPAFSKSKLCSVVSPRSVNAFNVGKRFGFDSVSSDEQTVFKDPNVNTVVIATRHNDHADHIIDGLENGKNIFCEKPLCLTLEELKSIKDVHEANPKLKLVVGFNRRFSPLTFKAKQLLKPYHSPKNINILVNAGRIEESHWTQDPLIGGGRIIGEACHFIDLAKHFVETKIVSFSCSKLGLSNDKVFVPDNVVINLRFECGSNASIQYLSNGHKSFPKERVEIFCGGRALQINNFKTLRGWGFRGFNKLRLWRQDKGVNNLVENFISSIKLDQNNSIPIEDIFEVAKTTIEVSESIRL